jgi:hypothetical protein
MTNLSIFISIQIFLRLTCKKLINIEQCMAQGKGWHRLKEALHVKGGRGVN